MKFRVKVGGEYIDVTVRAYDGVDAQAKIERLVRAWSDKEGFEFEKIEERREDIVPQVVRPYNPETDWVN